jgi:hypothetical protein
MVGSIRPGAWRHECWFDIPLLLPERRWELFSIPSCTEDRYTKLANAPRISYSMPLGCVRTQRFLLHRHSRLRISRRYIQSAHAPLARHLSLSPRLDTLLNRRRPPKRRRLRRASHERAWSTRLQLTPPSQVPRNPVQGVCRTCPRDQ